MRCVSLRKVLGSVQRDQRRFHVAFYGDFLEIGKAYILWGSARLPGNHETSAPMVCNPAAVLIILLA
jgi:hypothetical protein